MQNLAAKRYIRQILKNNKNQIRKISIVSDVCKIFQNCFGYFIVNYYCYSNILFRKIKFYLLVSMKIKMSIFVSYLDLKLSWPQDQKNSSFFHFHSTIDKIRNFTQQTNTRVSHLFNTCPRDVSPEF